MVKFGHWGPNAGPPPIKGRDGSPRRTVVNRTGGGFKYREDVEAMRAELRTLREKLDGAEFSLSEGASREYAAEARVREACGCFSLRCALRPLLALAMLEAFYS